MTGRGFGVDVAFEDVLPSVVRELFALITHLGDAGFALAAVALTYWFADRDDTSRGTTDRERAAFALTGILGAFALTLALKGLFGLPRPPAEIHFDHAEGYGFPSGHAVTVTALWGLLALVVERGTPRVRAVVAAIAITIVALSRVVIGVHYAIDVVVSVGVGIAYLAVFVRATDWRPTRGFTVAGALALTALVINGLTANSVATVAGVLGAGATWVALDSRRVALESTPWGRLSPGAAVGGLAVLGVVGYAGNHLVASLPAVFVLNLVVLAGILALPLVVERAKRQESASPT
jgi:membrane-associated phospholipid phosphatase